MIRSIIFWTHLCCGIASGLIVLTMSATGVLLMYERQMLSWAGEQHYVPPAQQTERLSVEQLITMEQLKNPDFKPSAAVISNHPGAPLTLRAGRRGGASLNPYTGEAMETSSETMESFFRSMTGFHRWFNVEGENRAIARQVTGVSNVIFLFLVLSGIYLWLPKIYRWTMFKARLLFRGSYPDSKARDFHWHHIFGIWVAIPLIAVVYSGAVISYPWAANFLYRTLGEGVSAAPTGGGPGGPSGGFGAQPEAVTVPVTDLGFMSLDVLQESARAIADDNWNSMSIALPAPAAEQVSITVDYGNGAQAQLQQTLVLDRRSGALQNTSGFSDLPRNRQLRTIARFLHTGEILGFWGQTIAGIASLAAIFLVYTGFALSYRRLIQPLFRKRR